MIGCTSQRDSPAQTRMTLRDVGFRRESVLPFWRGHWRESFLCFACKGVPAIGQRQKLFPAGDRVKPVEVPMAQPRWVKDRLFGVRVELDRAEIPAAVRADREGR